MFSERGLPAPAWLIQQARDEGSVYATMLAELAEAVAPGDGARLAAAIEAAETCPYILLAARMRIAKPNALSLVTNIAVTSQFTATRIFPNSSGFLPNWQ